MTAETWSPWGDFDAAQQEAEEGGTFKPIPAGPRDFHLFEQEIVPYTNKPDSPYSGLYALNVQLKVPDGEEHGNRRVFSRVPLFPKSPPSGPGAKEPGKQYVQYDFFNFFQKSLGWDADKLKAFASKIQSGDISAASALLKPETGKRVGAILKVTPADDYNPEGGNEVRSWTAPSGTVKTTAVAADAWAAAPASTPTPKAEDPWASAPREDSALAAAAAASTGF